MYTLGEGALEADSFQVQCSEPNEDGTVGPDFGEQSFVLQDDGSLLWFDTYVFYKESLAKAPTFAEIAGVWRGVDTDDGSLLTIGISDCNDETCRLRGR